MIEAGTRVGGGRTASAGEAEARDVLDGLMTAVIENRRRAGLASVPQLRALQEIGVPWATGCLLGADQAAEVLARKGARP